MTTDVRDDVSVASSVTVRGTHTHMDDVHTYLAVFRTCAPLTQTNAANSVISVHSKRTCVRSYGEWVV